MPTRKPLRIAIAGLGRIGWDQHAMALAKHPDFTIAAVSDTEPARRQEAQEKLNCRAFDDYYAMLKGADLDAVVVATPTHLHKPMALAAFKKGLDVLLEKPMAVDYPESLVIVRDARRHKRILTIYQTHRILAYFQQLRQLLKQKKIGRICRVKRGFFSFGRRSDWQALRKYGGGMLANFGAHGIDQVLQLIGYDIRQVFCATQLVAGFGDAEDTVSISLQTKSGVIGQVDISMAAAVEPYRLIVFGQYGSIHCDDKSFYLRYFDPKSLPPKSLDPHLASAGRQYCVETIPFTTETIPFDPSFEFDIYADFARSIRKRTAPYVKPEETLAVMKLIDHCRHLSGKPASLHW